MSISLELDSKYAGHEMVAKQDGTNQMKPRLPVIAETRTSIET